MIHNHTPWLMRGGDAIVSTSLSTERMTHGMPSSGTTPADIIFHIQYNMEKHSELMTSLATNASIDCIYFSRWNILTLMLSSSIIQKMTSPTFTHDGNLGFGVVSDFCDTQATF